MRSKQGTQHLFEMLGRALHRHLDGVVRAVGRQKDPLFVIAATVASRHWQTQWVANWYQQSISTIHEEVLDSSASR